MKRIALSVIVACFTIAANGAEPKGREVFESYCSHCHGPGDAPATVQLGRTRGMDKALLAERTDLQPEYIEFIVRHGLKSMPPFAPADLDAAKLKALIAFLTKKEPEVK
jgi:mono/diheme cytochrome c family protein